MSLPDSENANPAKGQAGVRAASFGAGRVAFFAGSRVAFFGGSFDPPHLGHLAVARAARAALRLDKVLFAPVGAQPLKPEGPTASFQDRVAMTELAIAGEKGFELSLADAPRPGGEPNFTLETLENLRSELGAGSALFCLMGADSFFGLRKWHRASEIPFVAPLIVASRPGEPLEDLRAGLPEGLALLDSGATAGRGPGVELREFQLANARGERAPFYVLPGLHVEISATVIRRRMGQAAEPAPESMDANGAQVPAAVEAYIWERGLYR
jgi:nicotinate-nucleotide adenylyltransferase